MSEELELLREAIVRNRGVVLSLPSAGILRHHKSRFLADGTDGFWIESIPSEMSLLNELIASATPAGLSFRSGVQKVMMASPILRREPNYKLNDDLSIEALFLAHPQQVKSIQRRANYRVPVHTDFKVRVWRIAIGAYLNDRPMSAQELPGELVDISLGGIGVRLRPREGKELKVSTEDRLRIELTYAEQQGLIVEGRLRHMTPSPIAAGTVRAGIQFKPLDGDLTGRQKLTQLTRIIGELHRHEVRQTRRDMVAAANPAGAPAMAE